MCGSKKIINGRLEWCGLTWRWIFSYWFLFSPNITSQSVLSRSTVAECLEKKVRPCYHLCYNRYKCFIFLDLIRRKNKNIADHVTEKEVSALPLNVSERWTTGGFFLINKCEKNTTQKASPHQEFPKNPSMWRVYWLKWLLNTNLIFVLQLELI